MIIAEGTIDEVIGRRCKTKKVKLVELLEEMIEKISTKDLSREALNFIVCKAEGHTAELTSYGVTLLSTWVEWIMGIQNT